MRVQQELQMMMKWLLLFEIIVIKCYGIYYYLLAEESLKIITPASIRTLLAGSEIKRFAPSTMYLNLHFPFGRNNLSTLLVFIESGLPPQGTKKSATTSGLIIWIF